MIGSLFPSKSDIKEMLLTVVVPEGLKSGDVMLVEAPGGEFFEVEIPHGCLAGQPLEVDLPVTEEVDMHERSDSVEVVVPDGVFEGDPFCIETEVGCFDVCVPEGCSPGDAILVMVPDDGDSGGSSAPTGGYQEQFVDDEEEEEFRFKAGQRVE